MLLFLHHNVNIKTQMTLLSLYIQMQWLLMKKYNM